MGILKDTDIPFMVQHAADCWQEHLARITQLATEHPEGTIQTLLNVSIPQPDRVMVKQNGDILTCHCGCVTYELPNQSTGKTVTLCRDQVNLLKLESFHPNGHRSEQEEICYRCTYKFDDFGIVRMAVHTTTGDRATLREQLAAGVWFYHAGINQLNPLTQFSSVAAQIVLTDNPDISDEDLVIIFRRAQLWTRKWERDNNAPASKDDLALLLGNIADG